MSWLAKKPRTEPYTEAGIMRVKCVRCGQQALHQWNVCADKNHYRALCLDCDIDLNRLVLEWANDPNARQKIEEYEKAARAKKRDQSGAIFGTTA